MAMDLTKAMEPAQEAQSRRAWRVETSADAPKTTLSAAAQRLASVASAASPLHAGVRQPRWELKEALQGCD